MDNLAVSLRAAAGNVGAGGQANTNPNAWDISYAEIDNSNSSGYYDIDEMVHVSNFSVASQEATPRGLFFKSDGTKMYVIGNTGDDVNEYALSTAWDPTSATFTHSFSVNSQETAPTGIHFKPDGTKMYITGNTGDDINEYDLSTAWDVSTASYNQNFSVASQETLPSDLWFKPDGTKMFMNGPTNDAVFEYDLSTAWDISTASYSQSFSLAATEANSRGMCFNEDGTGMWICGLSGDGIDEYSLSTAWDVSTATHVQYLQISIGISSAGTCATGESGPTAIFFKPGGDVFYVCGTGLDTIHTLKLGIKYLYVGAKEATLNGLFFKSNGTKLYIMGRSSDSIHEYDLSTAWDVSSGTFNQTRSLKSDNSVMTAPQGCFFKSDGTKLYVTGSTSDVVAEYDLSTAWDISTMSHNQNFSVATQEATPNAVFFKDDGTKMYVTGNTSDTVFEYDLSTAWDVSTASYSQGFSVALEETAPRGLSFKDDGTKMYVQGSTGDDINEYDLSTAWDVSTATFNQVKGENVKLEANLEDFYFKPDGTYFWTVGNARDRVYQYIIRSS